MAVRVDAAAHLQPRARVGRDQRQHGVRRRGRPRRVRGERAEQVAVELVEAPQRGLVLAGGPLELGGERRVAGRAGRIGVKAVRGPAHAAQERAEALPHARGLQLVAQDRGERQRHRHAALEHVEDRQVGGRHRLEQPLLAERPRAEALDVRHVRVEDERELAVGQGRHTARKSSARSSPVVRSVKSRSEIAGVNQS
jgi:hypothetical protein